VSPAYEHIWGRSCQSLYEQPNSWADCIHPDDAAQVFASSGERRSGSFDYEFRIVRADEEVRWINMRGFPILDESGAAYRTAGVATDITLRKDAERKITRLNHVYAVLSGINSLIVRVPSIDELLKEACRIVVEAGLQDGVDRADRPADTGWSRHRLVRRQRRLHQQRAAYGTRRHT
jgi:PAS domain S-box-containing protein